jgi:hypothetical protein
VILKDVPAEFRDLGEQDGSACDRVEFGGRVGRQLEFAAGDVLAQVLH